MGSGKTKVILPLLCQAFLSSNAEVHEHLARGGPPKHVLIVLVPEHLLADARAQVLRYCAHPHPCPYCNLPLLRPTPTATYPGPTPTPAYP